MQLSEVVEVTQAYGVDAANRRLAEGWKLLAVVATTNPGFQESGVTYVLGKAAPESEMAKALNIRFPN